MSELRWNWVYFPYLDAPNKQEESALKAGYIKVVSKDEADKVIAELKDKLRHYPMMVALLESDKKEIAELKDKALQYKVLNEEHCRDLNTQERLFTLQMAHQKYKRCLEMARWCQDKLDVTYGFRYKHFEKWKWRWLELAKEFKPNNKE